MVVLNYYKAVVLLLWSTLSVGYRLPNTDFLVKSRYCSTNDHKPFGSFQLSMSSSTIASIYGESDSERLKKAKLRLAEAQVLTLLSIFIKVGTNASRLLGCNTNRWK